MQNYQYANNFNSSQTITIAQAKAIIKHNRKMKVKRAVQWLLTTFKQKSFGMAVVLFSLAIPFLLEGDITLTMLLCPMGLYLMINDFIK